MSTGKKKGLGRGLSALFGDEKPVANNNKETTSSNKVSISDLSRNPYQPRQNFSEEKLEELTNSIRKNGIIQPIAVRPSKSDPGRYEIVAGERRWLAAQKAGLHEIPVTVLDLSDVESLEVAIVENIQRDVNVALMNEFVKIFDKLKIDFNPILEAASTKWNFLNFKPGLVGGHCIGVDPYYLTYLASKKGFNPDLIIQARKINEKMANFHSNKILNLLNKKIKGKKILICGFSFKANCSDYRNTGVLKLYNILKKKYFKVDVFDPLINSKKVYLDHKLQLVTKVKKNNYDVVVLAVDHKKFRKLGKKYFENLLSKKGQIYDLKNLFS